MVAASERNHLETLWRLASDNAKAWAVGDDRTMLKLNGTGWS